MVSNLFAIKSAAVTVAFGPTPPVVVVFENPLFEFEPDLSTKITLADNVCCKKTVIKKIQILIKIFV
jgi:hypothetical protein